MIEITRTSAPRHTRMFEYLHQAGQATQTARRLDDISAHIIDDAQARHFRDVAIRSLTERPQPLENVTERPKETLPVLRVFQALRT